MMKIVQSLAPSDLIAAPVWQYVRRASSSEPSVRPVKRVPVNDLAGKLVATQIVLANGSQKWALIGNIYSQNPRMTEHFVTLNLEHNGKWFSLARYHDYDYIDRGPMALAEFLELPVHQVFPISYDVRQFCLGNPDALKGSILSEPRERLTRAEIIAMAVP
jgi:hypothetical protein